MIGDDDLVRFLRWALPRLGRRWSGYRKVRGAQRDILPEIVRTMRPGAAFIVGPKEELYVDAPFEPFAPWFASRKIFRLRAPSF